MNQTIRDTKQRNAIKHAVDKYPTRALSPNEILEVACEEVSNLGIATVYRNIKTMVEQGELLAVQLPGMADRYQRPERRLPHILIDEKSGRVATFSFTKGLPATIPLPNGYTTQRVQLIAYGSIPA